MSETEHAIRHMVLLTLVKYRLLYASGDPGGEIDAALRAINEAAEESSVVLDNEEDCRLWFTAVQMEALQFLESLRGAREHRP